MESFNQNVIKHKTGLLNLAAELGNISKACRIMGFSRDTFYRYQIARDAGGVEALFEVSRKKPNIKNRVGEATEQAVIDFAMAFPAHGQVRASNELRKAGTFISPSGVRSVWLRHNLASMKQRPDALEKKSAEDGIVLTEAQVQALARKKYDDEACGEIESHHPGSQDTFYVGTIKGVVAFTNKLLWIPIPSGQQRSCTPLKRLSPEPICSMTGFCLSSLYRKWALSAC